MCCVVDVGYYYVLPCGVVAGGRGYAVGLVTA